MIIIRLDQVGYASGEVKIAALLAPRDAAGARVRVVDPFDTVVLSPTIGASRGAWNATLRDVRQIDLNVLTRPGTYRLRVDGPVTVESPPFHIETAEHLFAPLTRDSVTYFQARRDGTEQVAGVWQRKPSHLADRTATVRPGRTLRPRNR